MTPSQVNEAYRLFLVAKRCGADILDDAQRFDKLFSVIRLGELDRESLALARRMIESFPNGSVQLRAAASQLVEYVGQ